MNRKHFDRDSLAGRGATAIVVAVLAGIAVTGCGTTKLQRATQQMVLSDAVDRAVSQIDFTSLEGRKVFLDTSYIRQIKGLDFVNAPYIISSLRHRLTLAGGLLVESKNDAEIIVEPRVATLGYDGHDVTYGIPSTRLISSAAAFVPNVPQLPPIPEMSLAKRSDEVAIAKINVFAYERATGAPVQDWKTAVAKSTARDTWVLGAGPFQSGTIYSNPMFVGQELHLPRIRRPAVPTPSELARLISHEEALDDDQDEDDKEPPAETDEPAPASRNTDAASGNDARQVDSAKKPSALKKVDAPEAPARASTASSDTTGAKATEAASSGNNKQGGKQP